MILSCWLLGDQLQLQDDVDTGLAAETQRHIAELKCYGSRLSDHVIK